jgi:hypothetical protein
MSPHSNKRRMMSTDSATEPPSSAASYSSYNGSSISSLSSGDGCTSAASTPSHHSKKNSMDFSFSPFSPNGSINQGLALRGSGNTFWHPPMMPQNQADAEAFGILLLFLQLHTPRASVLTRASRTRYAPATLLLLAARAEEASAIHHRVTPTIRQWTSFIMA